MSGRERRTQLGRVSGDRTVPGHQPLRGDSVRYRRRPLAVPTTSSPPHEPDQRSTMTTFVPLTIQRLAAHLADEADPDRRWLLLLEFLEE